MAKNCIKKDKGIFEAKVAANKNVSGCFYRISLEFTGAGAKAFTNAKPGQFAEFDLSNAAIPEGVEMANGVEDAIKRNILLRRPFSFSDITGNSEKAMVEVLYCVVGPSSLRMAGLKAGQKISVMGPLGNGFWVPKEKTTALLVIGGMGAGPIEHLTNYLCENFKQLKLIVFAGARSKKDMPFDADSFSRYKTEIHVTTDDGSVGTKGFVTEKLYQWLDKTDVKKEKIVIYSCGPEGMLGRLAQIAKEKNIDCQLSMERSMACGIGLCQSCAVECKNEKSEETFYKMCCKDGPVFDSKEIVFKNEK